MDNIFSGSSGRPGESEEIFGADQWVFGYSAALQSLDVPPNPQVYCSHVSDGLFYLHINTSMINSFFSSLVQHAWLLPDVLPSYEWAT
jgi:hypothetical protein